MAYRVRLRELINDDVLADLLDSDLSNADVADGLSTMYEIDIKRQNVEYWRKQYDEETKRFRKASTNKTIKTERETRTPSDKDWQAVGVADRTEHNLILVIPDLHIPYHHQDAFDFLSQLKGIYAHERPTVVCLGDELDNHALSFHDSDPNLDSAGAELNRAREAVSQLESIFPEMRLCHSNHGSLHYRRAKAHGIPVEYLRTYREVLFPNGKGQGWDWAYSHELQTKNGPILFRHQCTGNPKDAAAHEGTNLVVGHHHGRFDLAYGASTRRLYWGATSGCLLDKDSLAFAYGREAMHKPILGAMVIINGIPTHIPMILDEEGRWINRSK